MANNEVLTELDRLLLRRLFKAAKVEELAKELKQSPVIIGKEIAKLQLGGYITDDGSLTAKGVKVAKEP